MLSVPKWCVTVHICSDNLSSESLCEGFVVKVLHVSGLILKGVEG